MAEGTASPVAQSSQNDHINQPMRVEKHGDKKLATPKIIWSFAVGQLGWAILSGIVSNWLVYYYQPSAFMKKSGMTLFITQGALFAGITLIGLIAAAGRLIDAFLDPWIGAKSDSCKHRLGRRMPFMRYAAVPFGLITTLVFVSPLNHISWINDITLLILVLAFYFCMTCYCTPFNALIPELGRTQELRINVSTTISITFFFGTAFAYLVPNIASLFTPILGVAGGFRTAIGILSVIAIICMLVPTFTINEKEYAQTTPSTSGVWKSLSKTFKNKDFQVFIGSDILYWIALTIFQTGMPFYVTVLIGFSSNMTSIFFVGMTILSLCFYAPVNILAKRIGKKKLVAFAFFFFCLDFFITAFAGTLGIPSLAWAIVIAVLAAIPMAILGILPQAVLADIAEADSVISGENRQGMFYAARTFSMKLGQSLAMIIFTSVALLGTNGFGYRATALVATVLCLIGGAVFVAYKEKHVLATIDRQTSRNPA